MKLIKKNDPILDNIISEREKQGQKIILNNSEVKYSNMLLELIQPFLSANASYHELNDLLSLGVIAWNSANIKITNPDIYKHYQNSMLQDNRLDAESIELFQNLIDRKVSDFSEYNLFIDEFELNEGENGMAHVTVICKKLEDLIEHDTFPSMPDSIDDESDLEEPGGFFDGFINRSAITVKPRQPFYDWFNKLYPDHQYDSMEENSIYLVKQKEDNEKTAKWIRKNFDKLFIYELDNWCDSSKDWPSNRTYKMFTDWFDVEITSMIYDLEKFPVSKD